MDGLPCVVGLSIALGALPNCWKHCHSQTAGAIWLLWALAGLVQQQVPIPGWFPPHCQRMAGAALGTATDWLGQMDEAVSFRHTCLESAQLSASPLLGPSTFTHAAPSAGSPLCLCAPGHLRWQRLPWSVRLGVLHGLLSNTKFVCKSSAAQGKPPLAACWDGDMQDCGSVE
jgi:hypothetical protein